LREELNVTFIAPILKITMAVDPNDFCSISLLGSIYKIITKIIANRLKKSQNAFI
jgi:hypothetical protein